MQSFWETKYPILIDVLRHNFTANLTLLFMTQKIFFLWIIYEQTDNLTWIGENESFTANYHTIKYKQTGCNEKKPTYKPI